MVIVRRRRKADHDYTAGSSLKFYSKDKRAVTIGALSWSIERYGAIKSILRRPEQEGNR
jgi:hypothetical protein